MKFFTNWSHPAHHSGHTEVASSPPLFERLESRQFLSASATAAHLHHLAHLEHILHVDSLKGSVTGGVAPDISTSNSATAAHLAHLAHIKHVDHVDHLSTGNSGSTTKA